MEGGILNVIWYLIVGALFTGYAILDGFDLGVGGLHLLARGDRDRRVFLNAIGPVWDGNQVWLVTGGGALFAAFPDVYATAFSGFYTAFILLLFMLIFRGVSIHVRSLRAGGRWRGFWDGAFCVSSVSASLIIGVAMGNIAWGVPIDADFRYRGDLLAQLHPYALLTGVTVVALFLMHGAIYLVMKTEGELNTRVRGWVRPTIIFFVVMYARDHVRHPALPAADGRAVPRCIRCCSWCRWPACWPSPTSPGRCTGAGRWRPSCRRRRRSCCCWRCSASACSRSSSTATGRRAPA